MTARMGSNMKLMDRQILCADNGLKTNDKQHLAQATQWWADGVKLQYWNVTLGKWIDRPDETNSPPNTTYVYRPKPKPALVPWTAETFPQDRPVWVRRKSDIGYTQLIEEFTGSGVNMSTGIGPDGTCSIMTWADLLAYCEQSDGEPCGTVEQ